MSHLEAFDAIRNQNHTMTVLYMETFIDQEWDDYVYFITEERVDPGRVAESIRRYLEDAFWEHALDKPKASLADMKSVLGIS